jgi:NAD(P)-dependent dehydrogenase (short-subunit alcohol dehydrogenase family)
MRVGNTKQSSMLMLMSPETRGEIAQWIVAISDPGATWVTGQVLGIDGGMSLTGA